MSRKKISLDQIPVDLQPTERPYDVKTECPTPEQAMLREAVRHLTPKQRAVWELHAYDKLSERKIADKLGKRRTTIQTQIAQCEARIAKWCKANMGAYKLIKQETEKE